MKTSKKKKVILSTRFTVKEEEEISKFVENNDDFDSTGEALHVLAIFGLRFFKLKKLAENPEFVNQLEEQFHIQITKPSIEKIVKNMQPSEIDALMLKIRNIREEVFNSLIKND